MHRTPYDSTQIGGFLIYYVHGMTLKVTYFVAFFAILTVFVSICMYVHAMCEDFRQTFGEIDGIVEMTRLKRILIETIEFHGQIYK